MNPQRRDRAFTLIEILVVVAILALLVAILLPSLQQARTQAKIGVCKANSKQIATAFCQYQAENGEYVPVVFNYFANGNPYHNAPARACWLSVALRKFDKGTTKLKDRYGGQFDPEAVWDNTRKNAYENRVMPAHFACPFERYNGDGRELASMSPQFRYYEWRGRFESYHTWLWQDIVRGDTSVHGEPWPGGPGPALNGVPQHTAFSWNRVQVNAAFPNGDPIENPQGYYPAGTLVTDPSKTAYRRWTAGDVRRMRSGSLSSTAVAYCAQGEHMLLTGVGNPVGRANVGSHRRGGAGSTNAIFADSHVESVKGTRIGWP
jgi:prepilin-type N-terminal cleavage/methylation domain-containing protein